MLKKIFICLLFIQLSLNAQNHFASRFGNDMNDYGKSLVVLSDTTYAAFSSTEILGNQTDILYTTLDNNGKQTFSKSIGNSGIDIPNDALKINNSLYVVGFSNSKGAGGYDGFLMKLNLNGDTSFIHYYGGSDWDFLNKLAISNDQQLIAVGSTYSSGYGNGDIWVLKLDTINGTIIWQKNLGSIDEEAANSVISRADGSIILCGYQTKSDTTKQQAIVYHLNNIGDSLTSILIGGKENESLNDLIELSNGHIMAVGQSYITTANRNEMLQVDFDSNLILMYSSISNKGFDIKISVLTEGKDKQIGLLGNVDNGSAGTGMDGFLYTLTENGGYINFNTIGSLGNDNLNAIEATSDSCFVMVGSVQLDPYFDALFVKSDKNKNLPDIINIGIKKSRTLLGVKLYPNPVFDLLTIDVPADDMLEKIEIYNTLGMCVYTGHSTQVDFSKINAGIYTIRIQTKNAIGSANITVIN